LNGHLKLWFRAALLGLLSLLVACASPHPRLASGAGDSAHWQGRLAVKVFGKPVQAFSADFELQGSPEQGTLILTSPLGTTLAHMQWAAGSAVLIAQGKEQRFNSIQELAQKAMGADLPITSLFAWLEGRNEPAEGWEADLQELPQGRIQARHIEEVQAELKIVLER
jgi:outer membrane lipoprotein LolB